MDSGPHYSLKDNPPIVLLVDESSGSCLNPFEPLSLDVS